MTEAPRTEGAEGPRSSVLHVQRLGIFLQSRTSDLFSTALGLWRSAIIAKRDHVLIGPLAQRLEARMNNNKFKANTVLAIKLARAVYFMLKDKSVFDPECLISAMTRT
jgi:hypothetical protein